MDRKSLGLIAATAAVGMLSLGNMPSVPNTGPVSVSAASAGQGGRLGNRLAQPGGGALAGILGGYGGYGTTRPSYPNKFPTSVAQGKRNARKARNRLRARGHHRKAVR